MSQPITLGMILRAIADKPEAFDSLMKKAEVNANFGGFTYSADCRREDRLTPTDQQIEAFAKRLEQQQNKKAVAIVLACMKR